MLLEEDQHNRVDCTIKVNIYMATPINQWMETPVHFLMDTVAAMPIHNMMVMIHMMVRLGGRWI